MITRSKKALIDLLKTVVGENTPYSLYVTTSTGKLFLEVDGLDGMQLDHPSLFETCPDDEAVFLLREFLENHAQFGFNLSCQLSRLLVEKGSLCSPQIETIITTSNWQQLDANFFALSYAIKMNDHEVLLPRLLDEVPEDFRDGLFLACFLSAEITVHDSLIKHFFQWNQDESWTPTATGELKWLAIFIKKWLGMYSFSQLESIIKMYFEQIV